LAALLGAVTDQVKSNMQKHGQDWMQISTLAAGRHYKNL